MTKRKKGYLKNLMNTPINKMMVAIILFSLIVITSANIHKPWIGMNLAVQTAAEVAGFSMVGKPGSFGQAPASLIGPQTEAQAKAQKQSETDVVNGVIKYR